MAEVLVRLLRKGSCKKEVLICRIQGRRTNGDVLEAKLGPKTTQGKGCIRNYFKIPGASGVSASSRGEAKDKRDLGF